MASPDNWQQINDLFHAALELPSSERSTFLSQASNGDTALQRAVEKLLAADTETYANTITLPAQVAADLFSNTTNLTTGQMLNHYRIVSQLGAGGMGEVMLAEDTQLRRNVAIKLLPQRFMLEQDRVRRFEQEARVASALNHPNIITIHEIGNVNQTHFIVTELIVGLTLRQRLKGQPSATESVLDWVIQIANALEAAHTAGIIHRDIKPENIMIRNDGIVKVLDFGLAKLTEHAAPAKTHAPDQTAPGMVMGTVSYMSPEQARGLEVDARSDIFSLGVVLYELLTGHQPFAGATVSDVLAAILMSEPVPVTRYDGALPDELTHIVSKSLLKDREQRYQTIHEFLLALKKLQQELAFTARLKQVTPDWQKVEVAQTQPAPASPERQAHLSLPPTPLVGREQEIITLKDLFGRPEIRLLTLTGPGGTGKTRLILQVAAELMDNFPDGVWFVSLSAISDPSLVPSMIAQTLGVKENTDIPLIVSLKEFLRSKHIMLVLDNFEQLVAGGSLITELLSASATLKIAITSRIVLRIRSEHEFPVLPLALPTQQQMTVEAIQKTPAVSLFLQRINAVQPDFVLTEENARTIAEICLRLDGLPLAIELAAARIKLLSPAAMLQRLDQSLKLLTSGARDLPARQQTIRNTITWSYDLLEESEKILFQRLTVFVGGCTLEAAEAICNNDGGIEVDLLDGIASLVDKSLLQQKAPVGAEPRFTMLLTIREYGLEQFERSPDQVQVRQAHAIFFLALAERATVELTSERQKLWLDQFELEHDNLRAALRYAIQTGANEMALRLGAALWRFWLMRGHLIEGRERLTELLATPRANEPSADLAKVMTGAATLAQNQGDYEPARKLYEQSLAIQRAIDDKAGVAASLTSLGWMAWRQCEYAKARQLSEEGLALHQELQNHSGSVQAINNLGWIAHFQGQFALAQQFHEECVTLRKKLADKRGLAFSLSNCGWALQKQGEFVKAAQLMDEALELMHHVGDTQLIAWLSCIRSGVAVDQKDWPQAMTLLTASQETFKIIADKYGLAYTFNLWGMLHEAQGNRTEAEQYLRESLRIRFRIGDRHGMAEGLELLSGLAAQVSNWETAVPLLAFAEALWEQLGVQGRHIEEKKQAALFALGEKQVATLWQEGQAMDIKLAVENALLK